VPSEEARQLMAPLVADPPRSAIVTDFDGTLSPIVDDPGRARPLDGAADLLGRLARRFAIVAVVSGRPVSFLAEQLAGAVAPVRLVGLYGLEWSGSDGVVSPEPRPGVLWSSMSPSDCVRVHPPGLRSSSRACR
jgi:trehalose 6-phosphate phosphatase